ncbi:hypothetical protein BS47DRAFT_1372809 [Hydnum rufescens UP504]|uniref:UDP-N-acetylglucosamine--dolichyl-phosphate N-acetylglucosaminephosphotransferase n=1 Tax=Hydnum rufescens UP504 TaxID=1448309 RepID=A0A9P6AX89_9AGAM|nr:hypothetical protein BS47DRAFT_1372809 [Hydnum rufescens UP504]
MPNTETPTQIYSKCTNLLLITDFQGPLYYLYNSLLSIFCTNLINILAGINGIEASQALIIALSMALNDLFYPPLQFSLDLASLSEARASPGDTFCYFAVMAFAVVGVIGHFSKTLLLFFIPQISNFPLSCLQLFGLVPCPRHRVPW